MLRLINRTPFQAEGALQTDGDGRDLYVVIVKGTFVVRAKRCEIAEEQQPVCLTDVPTGEPGQSSLRYASELGFGKRATDVVVNGHAYAPARRRLTELDVEVRVGSVRKVVRVFGDRRWVSRLGVRPGATEPFEKIPLVYERAFGGTAPDGKTAEPRNPVGLGFGRSADESIGQPLPNLEDPDT